MFVRKDCRKLRESNLVVRDECGWGKFFAVEGWLREHINPAHVSSRNVSILVGIITACAVHMRVCGAYLLDTCYLRLFLQC